MQHAELHYKMYMCSYIKKKTERKNRIIDKLWGKNGKINDLLFLRV